MGNGLGKSLTLYKAKGAGEQTGEENGGTPAKEPVFRKSGYPDSRNRGKRKKRVIV